MNEGEAKDFLAFVPDFYYDTIARVPAGLLSILLLVHVGNLDLGLAPLVKDSPLFLLLMLLFGAFTLGVVLSGVSYYVFAWWSRPFVWLVVSHFRDGAVDWNGALAVNKTERKAFREKRQDKSVGALVTKQRAEMALATNLCSAVVSASVVGLLGGTLHHPEMWKLGLLVLVLVMLSRTYTYFESVIPKAVK